MVVSSLIFIFHLASAADTPPVSTASTQSTPTASSLRVAVADYIQEMNRASFNTDRVKFLSMHGDWRKCSPSQYAFSNTNSALDPSRDSELHVVADQDLLDEYSKNHVIMRWSFDDIKNIPNALKNFMTSAQLEPKSGRTWEFDVSETNDNSILNVIGVHMKDFEGTDRNYTHGVKLAVGHKIYKDLVVSAKYSSDLFLYSPPNTAYGDFYLKDTKYTDSHGIVHAQVKPQTVTDFAIHIGNEKSAPIYWDVGIGRVNITSLDKNKLYYANTQQIRWHKFIDSKGGSVYVPEDTSSFMVLPQKGTRPMAIWKYDQNTGQFVQSEMMVDKTQTSQNLFSDTISAEIGLNQHLISPEKVQIFDHGVSVKLHESVGAIHAPDIESYDKRYTTFAVDGSIQLNNRYKFIAGASRTNDHYDVGAIEANAMSWNARDPKQVRTRSEYIGIQGKTCKGGLELNMADNSRPYTNFDSAQNNTQKRGTTTVFFSCPMN